ncbi:hypothetical protein LTR62_002595 [Meristemomyces frigidus]|uniref:Uncharacterized protein n=1 Tax=Meristemomyces frigidus TaxID=1508187 RepID=A0AAN7TGR3_9PEZI|nr:hypothetical protein LTR62_002595 [Meristemomyces frigidus]
MSSIGPHTTTTTPAPTSFLTTLPALSSLDFLLMASMACLILAVLLATIHILAHALTARTTLVLMNDLQISELEAGVLLRSRGQPPGYDEVEMGDLTLPVYSDEGPPGYSRFELVDCGM